MRFLNLPVTSLTSESLWKPMEIVTQRDDTDSGIEDPYNFYELNSLGFRGHEFSKDHELVVSGCSVTWGQGVPQEKIWASELARKLGYSSYSNLGHRGGSFLSIIYNLNAHINKYGKPKYIFCLFPDPYRFLLPLDEKVLVSKVVGTNTISNVFLNPGYTDGFPKYSKSPYFVEEVVPAEVAVFHSFQALHLFSNYCKEAGIIFKWSTYNSDLYELMIQGGYEDVFPDYVDHISGYTENVQSLVLKGKSVVCHKEEEKKYAHCFHIGSDNKTNGRGAHAGVHEHIHIAEDLYSAIALSMGESIVQD